MDQSERDCIAEMLEPMNMITLYASGIKLVKVIRSKIGVKFLLSQDIGMITNKVWETAAIASSLVFAQCDGTGPPSKCPSCGK